MDLLIQRWLLVIGGEEPTDALMGMTSAPMTTWHHPTTVSPSPPTPWPHRQPWHFMIGLVEAAGAVALAGTVLGFAGQWHWALDLFAHFRGQYLVGLLVALLVTTLARRRASASLFLLGVVVNAHQLSPLFLPHPPHSAVRTSEAADGTSMNVLTFNLMYRNPRHQPTLDWLRGSGADLVFLCEVTPAWSAALRSLHDLYPHQHHLPQDDPFGCAVLSRHPWSSIDAPEFGPFPSSSLAVVLPWQGREILMLGMHPCPPGGRNQSVFRDSALAAGTDFLASHPVRTQILTGDLNATPWCHVFRQLIARTGLQDSAHGFGWQPTWRVESPFFQIPIDHVLATPDLVATTRQIGPDLGSDHRGIIATLVPVEQGVK